LAGGATTSTTGQRSGSGVGDSDGSDANHQAEVVGTGPGPVTTPGVPLLRAPWTIPAGVFAVAVAVRLIPLLVQHTLTGVLEYDDGVQFSAAAQLVAGHPPYRDFVFIQPPGVVLLLSPFTSLAHWTGDTAAMALARVVFITVAGANAALIAYLLRARGRAAALAGGLLYAVWQASVAAEHTLLLEPLLTFGVLTAMVLVEGPKRRTACVWAGVILGAATSVKVWMGPVALVFVWLVYRRHGRRESLRFVLGYVAALILTCGPFLILAPRQFVRQVVIDQMERPGSGATIWERLQYLSGLMNHSQLDADLTVHGLAVLAIVGIAGIVVLAWPDPGSRPWMAIGAMELVLIMVAPSFSYHYVDFPAGSVCILAGMAVPQARRLLAGRGRAVGAVAVAAVAALVAVLALSSVTSPVGGRTDQPALASFVAHQRCVWTPTASLSIALDVETRQIQRDCPYTTDPYGTVLDLSRGQADASNNAVAVTGPRLAGWQAIVRGQLSASSAIVADAATVEQGWSGATVALFHRLYVPVGQADGYTLYRRR
jgi:alpha-1,2-mannosyltransferase